MPIRWMSEPEARAFLAEQTEGRLATCDHAGQPYITPLNYLYHEGKIYFHCKLTGGSSTISPRTAASALR